MSNSYFQFKQFTVQQDKCAMKVSTDACLQGAWTPVRPGVKDVLDIGCGTGLLSLMLTQRNAELQIEAIELDKKAAKQAKENAKASPWKDRVKVIEGDVREYRFTKQYDMVICNPPFFNNSLLGEDEDRNSARHTLTLSYLDLFAVLKQVLKPTGYASIMLPPAEYQLWEQLVTSNGWGFSETLQVFPKDGAPCNRAVSLCGPAEQGEHMHALAIYNSDLSYTETFAKLLHSFYLYL